MLTKLKNNQNNNKMITKVTDTISHTKIEIESVLLMFDMEYDLDRSISVTRNSCRNGIYIYKEFLCEYF